METVLYDVTEINTPWDSNDPIESCKKEKEELIRQFINGDTITYFELVKKLPYTYSYAESLFKLPKIMPEPYTVTVSTEDGGFLFGTIYYVKITSVDAPNVNLSIKITDFGIEEIIVHEE